MDIDTLKEDSYGEIQCKSSAVGLEVRASDGWIELSAPVPGSEQGVPHNTIEFEFGGVDGDAPRCADDLRAMAGLLLYAADEVESHDWSNGKR